MEARLRAHGPGKKKIPVSAGYFPSKDSWKLRYVLSGNIPEPGE